MLFEKHPREAEIAKALLEPFWYRSVEGDKLAVHLSYKRAADLEMKICEALVEAGKGS